MEPRPRHRNDTGAIIFGLILLAVGGYYLLERTFQLALPQLDADRLWPIAVIVIGAAIVWNAYNRRQA